MSVLNSDLQHNTYIPLTEVIKQIWSQNQVQVYRFKYFRILLRIYRAESNIWRHLTTVTPKSRERYSKTPGPQTEKFLNPSLSHCCWDRCTFTYTERIKHLSCKIITYMHIYKHVFYVRLCALCLPTLSSTKKPQYKPTFHEVYRIIPQETSHKNVPRFKSRSFSFFFFYGATTLIVLAFSTISFHLRRPCTCSAHVIRRRFNRPSDTAVLCNVFILQPLTTLHVSTL